MIHYSAASATSCQVYPSEYAYQNNSVTRMESASANCRMYQSGLSESARTEWYHHCDGRQLKLADSDLGLGQYSSSDYYVWSAGTGFRQLLFIFPTTMVNLTTITLHYYSDSDSISGQSYSFPKMKFHVVPDTLDIWDGLLSYRYVQVAAVPRDGEPAGHRSVSINVNVNFNTTKVLMQKFSSSFHFAVSEVEFFTCIGKLII